MIGDNMIITTRNIPQAYDKIIRLVWYQGKIIADQRGNAIRELEDVVIKIDTNKITYPKFGPTTERYGKDFASGLISNAIAYQKYRDFEYSYGERIRVGNALEEVITMLKADNTTRRAVLPIYHPEDPHRSNNGCEVPCATQMYLRMREDKLNATLMMRSNDVIGAFPSDAYGFMKLQEHIADILGVEFGTYTHVIGSAHIIMENDGDFVKRHITTPAVWY